MRGAPALAAFLFALAIASPAAASNRGGLGTATSDAPRLTVEAAYIRAPHWRHGAPAITARAAWDGGRAAWGSGSALVNEAARYVGSGKFTRLPGAWCADAVSAWLEATGKPPLRGRMAGSALAYGPRVANPQPGDLVVMRTRRSPEGHVGIVVAVRGDAVEIVSGNWGGRVARATISRAQVTAFVRT
jgi:uncharacterized protein (TIGR02594 family)